MSPPHTLVSCTGSSVGYGNIDSLKHRALWMKVRADAYLRYTINGNCRRAWRPARGSAQIGRRDGRISDLNPSMNFPPTVDTLRRALAETTVRRTEILAVAAEPPRRASEPASPCTWSYIISLPRRRGSLQVQRPMQRISIALPCGGYMYISLDEFRQRRVEASPGVTRA